MNPSEHGGDGNGNGNGHGNGNGGGYYPDGNGEAYGESHDRGNYYDPGPSTLPAKRPRETPSPRSRIPTSSSLDGGLANLGSAGSIRRVGGKPNVASACGPCKRAHLACDIARPCKRCVNLGKEAQCEDVPHKKRGRPKVNKTLGEPYARIRPLSDDPSRYRGPPSAAHAAHELNAYPPPLSEPPMYPSHPINPPSRMQSPRLAGPDLHAYTPPAPPLFTVFTTTDFKVLRVTPESYPLTGYHPNEFVNISLLDWFHPADRGLIDADRQKLISTPYGAGPIKSDRGAQFHITQRSEKELLTPAEGMREPYPHQNVRVLRSDNQFSLFNVRLHLGGGLGGSSWRPETYGRIYLVVSFLLIPQPQVEQAPVPPSPARLTTNSEYTRRAPSNPGYHPPTPISAGTMPGIAPPTMPLPLPTTAYPPQPTANHGLPSFSSIAASVDSPNGPPPGSARYDTSPVTASHPLSNNNNSSFYYAPPPPPANAPGKFQVPPQTAEDPYYRAQSGPASYNRTPSPPPSGYRAPAPPMPMAPSSMPYTPDYSLPSTSSGYMDSRSNNGGPPPILSHATTAYPPLDGYRREEEYNRRNLQNQLPPPTQDYGKRTWEL